ncbi:hypothetical protein FSP39_008812 [Pinctada imbricata]|uniref:Xyloside xylosyltransferase 1 n=1 Tax=Pinctada imbricata TaxID=66713 RepID=A0AA88Y9U9_PINIB|nr:hypothetical protein FSP39_008812 [Pinctada imbricata]
MAHLNVDKLAEELHEIVKEMQQLFSYKPGAYYADALFFLSIAIHRVIPTSIDRMIMLDADLKFNADISDLYKLFREFTSSNVIGIARENQPVYRHTFSLYRSKHPGTRVGEPPPNGLSGFNSGVLLLHLDHMRKSELYNSVINPDAVRSLTQKYNFKGHLGDQDLFTLLSMEHEELFYFLPCGWNRQLCRWWEDKGYNDVFSSYFECQGHISIYHGNCNTPIPKLDWE